MRKLNLNKNDQKDIIKLFYNFDEISIDEMAKEYVGRRNTELSEKNRNLIHEIAKLEKEIEKLKNRKNNSTVIFKDIQNEIKNKFNFLSEETNKMLITAEYQYLSEKADIDYSGIYLSYIKVLEIELRKRIGMKEKFSFGNMLLKLEKKENLKTFINALNSNQILETRNKAVHYNLITRNECGKIRKILIEDGWLENLIYVLDTKEAPKAAELEKIEVLVTTCEGNEIYLNRHHYIYDTIEGFSLLAKKPLKVGNQVFAAKKIEINGLEYYIV